MALITRQDRAHLIVFLLLTVDVFGASNKWRRFAASSDWTKECNKCKCVWNSGKRTADCTGIGLSDIPLDLSSEIREIDFSDNPLYGLNKDEFANAQLRDVHKLKFQNCSLESVHKYAFRGLQLLIELDLSRNSITHLDKHTFRDNLRLRVLFISFNRIQRLEQGLFYNLTHLQRIALNNNSIDRIDSDVFTLLPSLQNIDLGNNFMKRITYDFTTSLPRLNSLNLGGNPWTCDCHLQQFRNKAIRENLITAPTVCAEPGRLRGSLWSDTNVIFACLPQIVEPALASTQIQATSSNVTLTCRVLGEPQPDVSWVSNGRVIERDPRINAAAAAASSKSGGGSSSTGGAAIQQLPRFVTQKRKIGDYTWNNLTITNVNYRDRGEYRCVARNPGGVAEKNVSLIVSDSMGAGGMGGSGGGIRIGHFNDLFAAEMLPWLVGLVMGIVVLVAVLVLGFCWCCCYRRGAVRGGLLGGAKKRRDFMRASDECIHLHGGTMPTDMEKALITDVNPVMKPPRVCSVQTSVSCGGGTEVCNDVKRNLLDSDSVFASGDDESRSLEFELQQVNAAQAAAYHFHPEHQQNHHHHHHHHHHHQMEGGSFRKSQNTMSAADSMSASSMVTMPMATAATTAMVATAAAAAVDGAPPSATSNYMLAKFRGNSYQHPYPPDLLPFPARMSQVSPAGSSASTVADTSRLPLLLPPPTTNMTTATAAVVPPASISANASPLHSPLYDLYRTLPYSRSHSPFVGSQRANNRPIAMNNSGGYVTIPRRPRQSWSVSEPTAASECGDSSLIAEPLYDNLGLRTTADGSSVLSLNKVGNNVECSTPKGVAKILPPAPIAESHHESSPPSALPLSTCYATLPRNQVAWAKANADNLATLSTPTPNHMPLSSNSISAANTISPIRRNSVAATSDIFSTNSTVNVSPTSITTTMTNNINHSGAMNPIKKVPPKPPPKPKKRMSTTTTTTGSGLASHLANSSGVPLFEGEGVDGTEV